ncbi:hypothetical protein SAMN05216403_10823 [Nitrosospira multiformis ATCC 25196]|uniref:Uncharacterized protein n=1 Tax=Nitrosospira multiformis (strain ATCC 25196 / NCIMB 11849 / C 71) TaxID=323848 RepID=A0A1H5UKL3_NITMU|nr:hypothetical protein SAMN05216403_10823 [Nitrosospira multiformis ATCC 25196]
MISRTWNTERLFPRGISGRYKISNARPHICPFGGHVGYQLELESSVHRLHPSRYANKP